MIKKVRIKSKTGERRTLQGGTRAKGIFVTTLGRKDGNDTRRRKRRGPRILLKNTGGKGAEGGEGKDEWNGSRPGAIMQPDMVKHSKRGAAKHSGGPKFLKISGRKGLEQTENKGTSIESVPVIKLVAGVAWFDETLSILPIGSGHPFEEKKIRKRPGLKKGI